MAKSTPRIWLEGILVIILAITAVWYYFFREDPVHKEQQEHDAQAPRVARLLKDRTADKPQALESNQQTNQMEDLLLEEEALAEEALLEELPVYGLLLGSIVDPLGNRIAGRVRSEDCGFEQDAQRGSFAIQLAEGFCTIVADSVFEDLVLQSNPYRVEIIPGTTNVIECVIPIPVEGSLGLEWVKQGDWLEVVSVMPGSSAFVNGLREQDIILSINGRDVAGISPEEALALMQGPLGSLLQVGVAMPVGDRWEEEIVELLYQAVEP